jgi:hypothetical protein
MSGVGAGGHQIAFKFGFVWNCMVWGNSRVASTRRRCSGQLAAMTWCVICGKGSYIGCHAGREIALGIVRRIRPWWDARRRDRGELQLRGGGLQMVGDVK